MKILYVTDALAIWGGLERVLVNKANYLASHMGYEVSVLTVNHGHHEFPFQLNSSISYSDLNVPFHFQYKYSGVRRLLFLRRLHRDFCEKFKRYLNDIRPDIIVCVRIEFVKDILLVKGNIPLIFESHATFWTSRFEGAGWLRRIHTFWMNLSARKVDAVIALTKGDAAVWQKINHSVYVIPDMVNLNDSGNFSDVQSKSVLFVGRLSQQKGIISLLEIWQLVYQQHSDWELHVYGEKGDIDETLYRRLLTNEGGIILHQPTQHIMEEYKKHSVLLLTSRYEPFGMVLPEAMSCGLPVISFDCPYGPKDIISDMEDGFLIKNQSVDDFAKYLCILIENPEKRSQMGYSAEKSSQRYSAKFIMPMWETFFTRINSQRYNTNYLGDKFCQQ